MRGKPAKRYAPVSKTWMEMPREYSLALGEEAKRRGIHKHELILERLRQAEDRPRIRPETMERVGFLARRQGKTEQEMIAWLLEWAVNNAVRSGM